MGPPSYPLKRINWYIDNKKARIRPDVIRDAITDFGYNEDDIYKALKKLKLRHFHRPSVLYHKKTHEGKDIPCDVYIARDIIKNKRLYTHFYIDSRNNLLIINSFHK